MGGACTKCATHEILMGAPVHSIGLHYPPEAERPLLQDDLSGKMMHRRYAQTQDKLFNLVDCGILIGYRRGDATIAVFDAG